MIRGITGTSCSKTGSLASILAGGLVCFGLLLGAGDAGADTEATGLVPAATAASAVHPRYKTFLKREWGIEILFVRQTSAGYMLEFRYKVIDPEKAMPLFERQSKPVLTHEETGAKLIVPTPAKTGALRNSNMPIENHTYWMFFANPGRLVDVGDRVGIEIGEFAVDGIVVQ
jgi:hypothetical protein